MQDAAAWTQIALNIIALIAAGAGFWHFLISPLSSRITAEGNAREKAEASRDQNAKEIREQMQTLLWETRSLETDRSSVQSQIAELRSAQQQEMTRLRNVELRIVENMGEVKTAIAEMEARLERAIRAAIREAAHLQDRGER